MMCIYKLLYLISTKNWYDLFQMWLAVHKHTYFIKIFSMLQKDNTIVKQDNRNLLSLIHYYNMYNYLAESLKEGFFCFSCPQKPGLTRCTQWAFSCSYKNILLRIRVE